ncbi:hypothetical protein ACN2WE_05310 [Streptomyces sp. cg28]|uniref:hypothetical protein n=1 Tax=Streptomyces sp. cg28 TaxID=3403457 RepID=UPI003B226A25
MFYDDYDGPLSEQLDQGGELLPLLTPGEARAARYAMWLFGQGDGPGSEAARELAGRLDRRLRLAFPDVSTEVPGVPGAQFGDL